MVFETKDLNFKKSPKRYKANANVEWRHNKTYRNPGWHFFKDVQTSKTYNKDLVATFHTKKIKGGAIFMQLHIPGFEKRVYTKVKAPITFESPKPYHKLSTPTLVIRKKGEAWKNPFVVVYEPYHKKEKASIQSVEKLEQGNIYKGLKIVSKTPNEHLIQYVITQSKDQIFKNENIYFKGSYAVITLNKMNVLQSIYIGEGEKLIFNNEEITTNSTNSFFKSYVKK